MSRETVDVLILGAGLAGLRAAISCLEAAPGLDVLVVSAARGPCGSSFANQNDALGIHAPNGPSEALAYAAEVRSLNRGAWLDQDLLDIQANEGWERFQDLLALGLDFAPAPDGSPLPHSSCFSPDSRRAYVFNGLSKARERFARRLESLGCRFLEGWQALALRGAGADGPAGALLVPSEWGLADPEAADGRQTRNGVAPEAPVAGHGAPGGAHEPAAVVRMPVARTPEAVSGAHETISASHAPVSGLAETTDQTPGVRFASQAFPGEAAGERSLVRQDGLPPTRDCPAPLLVSARAVIVALGGPGRLFAHSMAGPNPGFGHGLLLEAGARMANLGFLQFMWGTVPGKRFWMPAEVGQGGWLLLLREPAGTVAELQEAAAPLERLLPDLAGLAAQRAGHCPFSIGLPDSSLDLTLARGLDPEGTIRLLAPDGSTSRLAPMAHASNGGAVIDRFGRTSLPGVLACGECATGMHGANRIGGGMVLASQVFGHRAGGEAARRALQDGPASWEGPPPHPRERGNGLETAAIQCDPVERREGLAWLARGLSRFAVLGGMPGADAFSADLNARLASARDRRLVLSLLTARGILEGLPGGT